MSTNNNKNNIKKNKKEFKYKLHRNKKLNSKYHPLNQKWSVIDQHTKCKDKGKVISCPVCREHYHMRTLGHVDVYLISARKTDTHIGANIVCKHCHFTMNRDTGRDCWCVLKQIMLPKSCLKKTYVLDEPDNLPQNVKDDLSKDVWV